MKISFYSIPFQITDSLKEKIQIVLSEQNKKIVALVALILSGFALFFIVKRCYKAKSALPVNKSFSPEVKPVPPEVKFIPPFVKIETASKQLPLLPSGYEWVKKRKDAENFMTNTKDISIIIQVARTTLSGHFKFGYEFFKYGNNLRIVNLIQFATLDQIEAITKALAQDQDANKLRDIFSHIFNNIDKFPNMDIYKEQMKTVVKSLSSDQFMTLLYISENSGQNKYKNQLSEISDIPLQSFLKGKAEFSFPDQFLDGCLKVIQYSKDIKSKANREPVLCD